MAEEKTTEDAKPEKHVYVFYRPSPGDQDIRVEDIGISTDGTGDWTLRDNFQAKSGSEVVATFTCVSVEQACSLARKAGSISPEDYRRLVPPSAETDMPVATPKTDMPVATPKS